MKGKLTYKKSGVDIQRAESALAALKQKISETFNSRVLTGIGLFGGFYELPGEELQKPVLVASTDGVGTKIRIAIRSGIHHTIGQDLVNHCINDIAVSGARPIFFLDYFASGKLDTHVYEQVITGMTVACKGAGIPLIGGETAEMPDFYAPGDYDISGTIVGIVEKDNIIDGRSIRKGDVLIGLSSNGLHTNGYSLARKVLFPRFKLKDVVPGTSRTFEDELLRIHPNYFPAIQQALQLVRPRGIAHITGGGIVKNTLRLLPDGLAPLIQWGSWPEPPIFGVIRETGKVPETDMRLTFNLGIGLVFVLAESDASVIMKSRNLAGFPVYKIGTVENV